MRDADDLVQRLYVEAAAACGDDVHAIARYVEQRLGEMSADDQSLFRGVTENALAFQAPIKRPEHDH